MVVVKGTEIEIEEVSPTKEEIILPEKTFLVNPGSRTDRHIRLRGNNSSQGEILMKQTVIILADRKMNIMIIDHQVGNNRETLSEKKCMKRETTRIITRITNINQTAADPVRREDQNVDMPGVDNLTDRVRGVSEWLRLSDGLSRGRVTPGDGLTETEAQDLGEERKQLTMIWMRKICPKLVMPSPLIRKSLTQKIIQTEANGNEALGTITEVVHTTITMANIMRKVEDQ